MTEFREKQRRIQALLERHKLHAVLLGRVSNFAWATCGAASYVNTAVEHGKSQLGALLDSVKKKADTVARIDATLSRIHNRVNEWGTSSSSVWQRMEINGQAFFRPAILERK